MDRSYHRIPETQRDPAAMVNEGHRGPRLATDWESLPSEVEQVCFKGLSPEGAFHLQPSSSSLQGHYGALWKLLEQRSLLLFMHEYTRRVRSAAAYVTRLNRLLEGKLRKNQTQAAWPSFRVGLGPLSQELHVHLNHWSCLSSKARSDCYLRPVLAQQTSLLAEIRQTLNLLGLQALVLMERCVYAILPALAQTQLKSAPREVLEDILAGTELYNQAVQEQRAQHSATHRRTVALHQADCPRLPFHSPNNRGHHPAAFPVKELMRIIAIHRGEMAAKQLHHWASEQSYCCCKAHAPRAQLHCGASTMSACGPEWTWEHLPLHISLHPSSHPLHTYASTHIPDPNVDRPIWVNHNPVLAHLSFVRYRGKSPIKGQTSDNCPSQCQTCVAQTCPTQTSIEGLNSVQHSLGEHVPCQTSLIGCNPVQTSLESSKLLHPLSVFCQKDQSSVELLFQVMVSSSDLLAPLVPHTPTPEALSSTTEPLVKNTITKDILAPKIRTDPIISQRSRTDGMAPIRPRIDSKVLNRLRTEDLTQDLTQDQSLERTQQEQSELEMRPETNPSPGGMSDADEEEVPAEQDFLCRPRSVQWLDLGQSSVCAGLFAQYRTMLWTYCSHALWLHFHQPPTGGTVGSINLWRNNVRFQLLHRLSQVNKTDLVPKECRAMLDDFCLHLLVSTAHAHWDHVMCSSLGSGLTDKCLPESHQDSSLVMTATMEKYLHLAPPLLSSLLCHRSDADSMVSGPVSSFPSRLTLHRATVSLALASLQSSTVWVMSKAYQFLSSWSLKKFLLITQGDLKVLRVSSERLLQQTESLMLDGDNLHHCHHHYHHQILLRQQIRALRKAASELQAFSSLVLNIFSSDCKRMSVEIFEQTMPSARHWRLNYRTDVPSSPSEYASLAAQTVIGQVLDGVAPLSDDARVQALSVTMTAFMEAWMEHILRQKIKFSIQGALQLRQDFDSIRKLVQSDQYSLSAEVHQQLLNLRVFQQVDSAVVCLLQQPQAKPYIQSRGWQSFRRCCPTTSSRGSIDAAGGSITNLESMEREVLPQSGSSLLTSDTPPVAPTPPGEPYLAPSLALGAAQQEWLDLRIHNSATCWRLLGLHCLSKSEP